VLTFLDISREGNGNARCVSHTCRNFVRSIGNPVAVATRIRAYTTGLRSDEAFGDRWHVRRPWGLHPKGSPGLLRGDTNFGGNAMT
jgi:hypothetical protein